MTKKHTIENDDDDLKGMAPQLSKLSSSNPFKADNDYFENFADKLQNRIEDFEEINAEAPLLAGIPKYNPFDVPADYFDELPALIQNRCISSKPSVSIIEWLVLLIKPRFAIPVLATVLCAVAGINFMDKNAEMTKSGRTAEISIEERLNSIDESELIDELADDQADLKQNNTNESIENYLIDNNIDESNLNSEL